MSVRVVAGHDLRRIRRSRGLVGLVAVSLVVFVGGYLIGGLLGSGQEPASVVRVRLLAIWLVAGPTVGFVATVVGAAGIAGEQEARTLRLLASLPFSRAQLVYGKTVARVGAVTAAVTLGTFVSLTAVAVGSPVTPTARLVGFAGFTLAVAVSYVAVGVAVSTVVSADRVRAAAVGVFVATLVWPRLMGFGVEAFGGRIELLCQFLGTLTPFGAYSQVVSDGGAILAYEPTSAVLGSGVMALVLLAWTVGPLLVVRHQFPKMAL